MIRYISAIDPGKATGMASFDLNTGRFESWIEEDPASVTTRVRTTLSSHAILAQWEIVAEDFIISQRTLKSSRQKDALDLLGWLRFETERAGVRFTKQTAAQAKSFATDDKLKALGWFTKTQPGHDNDAARHLLVFLINKHPDERHVRALLEKLV